MEVEKEKRIVSKIKKDIRSLELNELEQWCISNSFPKYRAAQLWEWFWKHSSTSFSSITNIPKAMIEKLELDFTFHTMQIDEKQVSEDGTIKSRFKMYDGNLVEGVLIPAQSRMTACISSQVGCSLSCKFCATGYMDRKRNLTSFEIYDQVVAIHNQCMSQYNEPLSNIVLMGMGEPLLNYANVLKGMELVTSPKGLNMAPSRITLSTAGIAKMIMKLADDEVRFNLALSLHAADDEKRSKIMPINETNTLDNLVEALKYFTSKTKNKVTLEYIAFNNFNDSLDDAKKLLAICKKVNSKVNIIEYNPIAQFDFVKSSEKNLNAFSNYLEANGVVVNVRRSRGKDIDAACGQLANK